MNAWQVLPLVALVVLSGCLGSGQEPTTATNDDPAPAAVRYELPEDPMPEGDGHDHLDVAQHKFLWNYEFSARDPLMQDRANVAGLHALDVQAGHLFGAVYGAHDAQVNGGLVIWDLSDPAHPKQTGRWTIPGSVGGDRSMEATPDGEYAVIATEPVDCAGHVNPASAAAQAYLLDVRDKTRPVVADVMTITAHTAGNLLGGKPAPAPQLGQHSVAVHRIGGEDYAFIHGKIFHIDRDAPGGAKLVRVGTVNIGHDAYIRDTPWGTTWALASGLGQGVAMMVYDVTDPANTRELGMWKIPGQTDGFGDYYPHTADVSFQDGQIVIVESSEDWGDHVSPFWLIDGNPLWNMTEAPSSPEVLETLGNWSNPGGHDAGAGLEFSLHNPRFHDGGILTLSSYHGGMWQLDVRHPDFWKAPAPIGYAVYAEGTPAVTGDPVHGAVQNNVCRLQYNLDAPSYWDVEVGANGVTYLADGFMGLYTFVPAASHPLFGANRTIEYNGTAGL